MSEGRLAPAPGQPSTDVNFAGFSIDQAGRKHVGTTAVPVAYERVPLAAARSGALSVAGGSIGRMTDTTTPAPFNRERFVSPASGASAGTRAVVLVWSGLRAGHGEPFFHLSVARDGAEQYAFTYVDGEIRQSGEIPRALDPSRFFGALEDGAEVERSLLEAVAGEFGASLPRHAIVNGRLHTFTTRSWTRPPRDGETYAVIRMDWGDARPADGRRTGEDGPGSR